VRETLETAQLRADLRDARYRIAELEAVLQEALVATRGHPAEWYVRHGLSQPWERWLYGARLVLSRSDTL